MANFTGFTRKSLGSFLSTVIPTRTISSPWLAHTRWEGDEVSENWIVTFIDVDTQGSMTIECVPLEWFNAFYLEVEEVIK